MMLLALSLIAGTAWSQMYRIKLKNGKIISIPVKDIESITFGRPGIGAARARHVTWDFESGDLRGWRLTGTAFNTQPTFGDNPTARNRGQPSRHQGRYSIGGYENRRRPSDPAGRIQGDKPRGTMSSAPFTIRSRSISFLIGGGCDISRVRAELIVEGRVVAKSAGKCTETMRRARWDVSAYAGRRARIRLVDNSSGGWGHINFDDVRFE